MYRTDRSTMTLQEFLTRELSRRKWSVVDLEAKSGVSRGAIRNMLNNDEAIPTLETLDRLGDVFGMPLWRMVELAGFQSGMPSVQPQATIERVVVLARSMPELEEILDQVLELPPSEMAGVLAYLEALKRRRDDRGLDPGGSVR